MSDHRRTVVITGANGGIGLETAVAMARFGDRVVIACRNPAKAAAAVADIEDRAGSNDVESVTLDLASFASIHTCAAELATLGAIDVLINNAGLILSERSTTEEGFESTFGTNHLGPMLLTTLLEPQLATAEAARVVNVASDAHWGAVRGMRFDDLQTAGWYVGWDAYARSKLANIYFTQVLAERWADKGIVANCLHPGAVRTGFGRDGDMKGINGLLIKAGTLLYITPQQGALTSVFLATSDEGGEVSGRYYSNSRPGRLSPMAKRRADAERLWRVSEELITAGRP